MTTNAKQDGAAAVDSFRSTVTTLVNDLLDAWYDEHPSSSAFGTDYEAPAGTPDGTFYVGREHGSDGAEDERGFDFFYRRFRDPETRQQESEYVYGKYGWMDANQLVEESDLIRQVFAEAVEAEVLDEDALAEFDAAVEMLEDGLQRTREQYDLSDLAALFRAHDIDTLRTLLAHGDEEGRVVWQLCFSKDEDGNHIENPIEVPVLSEADQFMLVRTERYYYDEQSGDGKHYAYGAVIGYDDTPQRFFVHRLESDPDLRDPETEWTPVLVKEKMGFDRNLHEVPTDDLQYGETVRVQGDLAVVRHEYDTARASEIERRVDQHRNTVVREHAGKYRDAHAEIEDIDDLYLSRYGRVRVHSETTDELKALQDDLGIAEDTVREKQDERDISRLTAKRRAEIIEDLIRERVYEWACEQEGIEPATERDEIATAVDEDFTATDDQVNAVLGNHTVILGSVTEHPYPQFGDNGTQAAFVVSEEASGFVIHDEHEDKQLTLGPGIYEFRFLEGYSDSWWMDSN